MKRDALEKVAYHFPGISVLVPWQVDQSSEIVPLDWRDQIPAEILKQTETFSLIRYVANIVLFRKDHLEKEYYEEPVKVFNPPIEIRVSYTFDDVWEAYCDSKQLKLAYWEQENWVIISDPSFEYQILPPNTAQVAEVKIWSWVGDPMLAWGK